MPVLSPDPLRELLALQQQIARRVEERLGVGLGLPLESAPAAGGPPIDLYETEDAFVLKAELPGLASSDVALTIEGRMLTLRGTRNGKASRTGAGKNPRGSRVAREDARNSGSPQEFHRVEREHATFQRAFALPRAVDPTRVEMRWKDGVLEVTVSKKSTNSSSKRGKRRRQRNER